VQPLAIAIMRQALLAAGRESPAKGPHVCLSVFLLQAMASCAVNGLGLALVIPCVQSLTADYNPPESRGRAFGFMFFTGSLGVALLLPVVVCPFQGLSAWQMDRPVALPLMPLREGHLAVWQSPVHLCQG
jgi:MFS family permease